MCQAPGHPPPEHPSVWPQDAFLSCACAFPWTAGTDIGINAGNGQEAILSFNYCYLAAESAENTGQLAANYPAAHNEGAARGCFPVPARRSC